MTNYILNRKENNNHEIVIQEESEEMSEVEECLSFEEKKPVYKKICESAQIARQYNSEALKINKQKLLKYEPLKQKNREQNNHIKGESKNTKNQSSILSSNFRKSNSIKILKQIKHKVEICGKRLKTQIEKQNDLSHFLPKMPTKMLQESNNRMNKTVSAINLWRQSQNSANINDQFNQTKRTYVESRYKTDNQPISHKKASQDCFNSNSKISHSKKSRNFNKTSSLSKFSTCNDISYSHSEIMSILAKMNLDQQDLIQQKIHLQQRMTALREGIQKQNALIIEININQQKMSTSLAKKEAGSKQSANGAKISKKKNQNFQMETKDLQQKLQETAHNNNKVLQNIQQEKQLIRMYQLVIQQVKSQLKVEKRQKKQLQKKLAIMKKNQKSLYSKLCNHEDNNKQILRKIYHSLEKWH